MTSLYRNTETSLRATQAQLGEGEWRKKNSACSWDFSLLGVRHLHYRRCLCPVFGGIQIRVNCAVDRHLRKQSCENCRVRLLLLPATRSTTVLNRNFVLSVSLVLFHHDTSHVVHNTAYRWQLFLFCTELSWQLNFIPVSLPLPTPNVAQALSQRNQGIPGWNQDIYLIKVLPPLPKAHKPIGICNSSRYDLVKASSQDGKSVRINTIFYGYITIRC